MVSEGRGRLFRRKDDKYLIYVPLKLAEDSMFPFKIERGSEDEKTSGVNVKVSFKIGDDKVVVGKWEEQPNDS